VRQHEKKRVESEMIQRAFFVERGNKSSKKKEKKLR
jgi:hypothetical protein